MRKGKFIGVPKQIMNKSNGIPLMQKYNDDYMIATFYALRIGVRFDYSITTLKSLVISIGVPYNQKTVSKVRTSISNLNKEDLIYIDDKVNIEKIKPMDSFKFRIYQPESFFKLYLKAYDIIMINSKIRADSKISLLNTYSLIQSYLYNLGKSEDAIKNGRYQVCFPRITKFMSTTSLSNRIIVKNIDMLEDMDLIRHKSSGTYLSPPSEDNKRKIFKGANCYTNFSHEFDKDLKKYIWEIDVDGANKLLRKKMIDDGYELIKTDNAENNKPKGKRGDW